MQCLFTKSRINEKGFTLIEILFVVAIVAILAAIALPAYNNYINRGKLKTIQADLTALGLNFENRYQRMLSYPTATYASTGDLKTDYSGWSPASATTDVAFTTQDASASTYTLVATGQTGGIQNCVIKLKHNGVKEISNCTYSDSGAWL